MYLQSHTNQQWRRAILHPARDFQIDTKELENDNLSLNLEGHKERIRRELRDLGVSWWGMLYGECRYLHTIVRDKESVEAVTYGRHAGNRALLVATNQRLIYIDKKPLYTHIDEITYEVIGGVSFSQGIIYGELVLHSNVDDYHLKVFNKKCGLWMRKYIEQRCLLYRNTLK